VLFRSPDGGSSWARVDMGVEPKTTMFAIAFDERQPQRMYCATSGGEVFASKDGGQSWTARRLPEGATQVHAMGCGRPVRTPGPAQPPPPPRPRRRHRANFASVRVDA